MKIINDKNNEVNFSFKPHFCGDKTYISVDDLNETIDFYKVIINKLTDNISKIEKYCYERTYELKRVMERDEIMKNYCENKISAFDELIVFIRNFKESKNGNERNV